MAVESSLEAVPDPSPAIAGIVAVARASDAIAVRAVRLRRGATREVSSIFFLAFIFVSGLSEIFVLQVLFHGLRLILVSVDSILPTQTTARIPLRMAKRNSKAFAAREEREGKRQKTD